MKNFKIAFAVVAIFGLLQFASCHKKGDTPVDRYIEVLEQTTEKIKDLSYEDMTNVEEILSPKAALEISREYSDYTLSDSDKKRLKSASDKMVHAVFDKISEFDEVPHVMKNQFKSQSKLVIEALNEHIEKARTLGELDAVQ